jgi:hypothetical protein
MVISVPLDRWNCSSYASPARQMPCACALELSMIFNEMENLAICGFWSLVYQVVDYFNANLVGGSLDFLSTTINVFMY